MDDDGGSDVITTEVITTGIGLVNGTLYVIGTEGEDKVDIKLGSDGGGDQMINAKGTLDKKGIKEQFDIDFPASDVTDIVILLCGDDDDAHVHNNVDVDALIDGGEGDDKLKGGSGNDTLLGRGGKDDLKGYDGDDLLDGGDDDDKLKGGKGNDIMLGGGGDDDLNGGSDGGSDGGGDDVLSGGDGDDKLKGGKGLNVLIGGDGEDDIKGGGSDDGGDLLVGGWTIHDNDPTKLAEIGDIWTSGDPYNDIVDALTDSGGLLEVGGGAFGDGDEDKLEGHKRSLDLFFAEVGLDDLKGEEDDTVVLF
jgi:Ca2+-binding RTX toxin-like protein